MERIIDDLLTLAREGDGDLDTEPVSLGSVAHTAWAAVDSMDADATLDVAGDREVVADETAFTRLFENLFRNAVKHGACDVTVTVDTTENGFFVADDGPGIPETARARVFESGFTTSDEGTGFGLSIVAEVADAHDWTVDVTDSDAGGARFEFVV
jgi:signal transduction histidine kinase